jgi:hypothetical protein
MPVQRRGSQAEQSPLPLLLWPPLVSVAPPEAKERSADADEEVEALHNPPDGIDQCLIGSGASSVRAVQIVWIQSKKVTGQLTQRWSLASCSVSRVGPRRRKNDKALP